MSEFVNIVPWFDSDEWQKVYKLIYSRDSNENNKVEALNLLRIWKARCPSMPSGIESTFNLLRVHVEDVTNSNNMSDDQLHRLAYSSAIMRFVNHMLDAETAKGSSFYKAASNLGVPDWIVDLRHDTAHSNNLPSKELLREACILSLDWLKSNYWDKYTNVITNYLSNKKETDGDNINIHKLKMVLNFCIHINICIHSGTKIKNLADIQDFQLRMSLVEDIKEIFGTNLNLCNLKLVSMKNLENLIKNHCKKVIVFRNVQTYISQVFLADDSLLLSLDLLNCFDPSCLNTHKKLPKHYIMCFESLLILLHDNDLLQEFVFDLINFTNNSENSNRKLLAALWVSEILKAVRRLKQFSTIAKKFTPAELASKQLSELTSLFYHWFPNDKGILLNLLKPVPKEFTLVSNVQLILSSCNPYLSYFANDLLLLVEPPLPKSTIKRVCMLTQIISNPEKFPVKISSDIYTCQSWSTKTQKDPDNEITKNGMDYQEDTEAMYIQDNINKIPSWCLASAEYPWSACPIGLLPWSMKLM